MVLQPWKAPVYCYPHQVVLFIPEKTFKSRYYYYYFSDSGIPTLNMSMILINWYSSSWSIYTKDVSNLITEKHAEFELWCKVQFCHAKICSLIRTWYCQWYLYWIVSDFVLEIDPNMEKLIISHEYKNWWYLRKNQTTTSSHTTGSWNH